MDLIDRNKLKQYPIRRNHYDKKNGNEHFINGIESVMEYAECLPTVQIRGEPLVIGEWYRHYTEQDIYICNNCKKEMMVDSEWSFCPYCGAKNHIEKVVLEE